MERRVAFVGGSSGSGKTSFCEAVSPGWVHLNAGQLIAQGIGEGSGAARFAKPMPSGPAQSDFFQERLLHVLQRQQATSIVLDGHYVLATTAGLARVPLWFFTQLSPVSIYLVETPTSVIIDRLKVRAHSASLEPRPIDILDAATEERIWAEVVSEHLRLPLRRVDGQEPPRTWTPENDTRM